MIRRLARRQSFASGAVLPRHVHRHAYATVVLAGRYLETGDGGRHWIEAGDVVVHTPFEAHANRFAPIHGDLVNIALDDRESLGLRTGRVADPHDLLRELQDDASNTARILSARVVPMQRTESQIPDCLAQHLHEDDPDPLSRWADDHRIPPRTLRRQFAQLYDVTPAHFRARARALRAWRRITLEVTPLAAIACDCGFADQAHMSRAIAALTGKPPRYWRVAV